MEREIKRGDVYWLRMNNSVGSEETVKRPIVIVSSDRGNELSPVVNGVYITSQYKRGVVNVEIHSSNKQSWVMCNQFVTADKTRVDGYMCTLTESEMDSVDYALKVALGLAESEDVHSDEITELEERVDTLTEENENLTYDVNVWRKMYEKALEELVSARIELDLAQRSVVKPEPEPEVVESKREEVEPEPEPEPEVVEINTCTEADLRRAGCTPTMIHHIVANRPYASVDDLRTVPSITRVGFAILKNKIYCVPIVVPKKEKKPKKVNVNTATVEEMVEVAGLNLDCAKCIRAYRNKHGKFVSVEDLLNVPRFGKTCLKKYGPMLEV